MVHSQMLNGTATVSVCLRSFPVSSKVLQTNAKHWPLPGLVRL